MKVNKKSTEFSKGHSLILEFAISSPFGKEMANLAVQTPIQGALGSAGEASGQLLAKGEITEWGDVVAEFAGEGFTAPIEVLSAGQKGLEILPVR